MVLLLCFDGEAPFQGASKLGPLVQAALQSLKSIFKVDLVCPGNAQAGPIRRCHPAMPDKRALL